MPFQGAVLFIIPICCIFVKKDLPYIAFESGKKMYAFDAKKWRAI